MKRIFVSLTMVAGLTLAAMPVTAQSVFEACKADITNHCINVTPGDGRLGACLYAHEDQLSDDCDAAFSETADILDQVFERVRYASQQCGEDIRNHCSGTAIGQGRVFSCLQEKRASLSKSCMQLVDGIDLPLDR